MRRSGHLNNQGRFDPSALLNASVLQAAREGDAQALTDLASYADWRARDDNQRSALHLAARSGSVECVEFLLGAMGKDAAREVAAHGETALHEACSKRKHLCAKALLATSDPNAKGVTGLTALHYAALSGSSRCVKVLLDAKGESASDVGALCEGGRTALHYAARSGYSNVVSLLMPLSDLDAKDNAGRTALHLAALGGHEEIIRLLAARCDLEALDISGRSAADIARHEAALAATATNRSKNEARSRTMARCAELIDIARALRERLALDAETPLATCVREGDSIEAMAAKVAHEAGLAVIGRVADARAGTRSSSGRL